MIVLTKEQRHALKDIYDRGPVYKRIGVGHERPISYREFRRQVVPELGGFGAVMLPWCGMWLGIERDGRVHLKRVYIETKDKWIRYETPVALRTEIVAFDKGESN